MASLYTSQEAKREIEDLYKEKLASLGIPYEVYKVETSYGQTNVLATGDPNHPPLALVHGANGCAPVALEVYPHLADHYRVFAVDVIGEPNLSAETRPDKKDNAYGYWLNEVIRQLALDNVTLVGFSLGGLVIWKTLLADESNIKEAFLTAPAGIVNGNPLKGLRKVVIPVKRYMNTHNTKYIDQFLNEVFTEPDDFAHRFTGKVMLNFHLDFSSIPTIKKAEAKHIATPLTVVGAKHDIMFPGEKMIKRARKIFPSLRQAVLLEDAKHVQPREDNEKVEAMVLHRDGQDN
ncbi:MAG: alpha/beta hydrolase [Bacteroidetes bacterium SW_11_45_7]|nr:MAG: alpha/beta hydrolase [Bacteroidetes bacterium SW_11_45_7]